ncbi:hypothetical protein [Amycolatopsis cihanbeyliensis]|uniref:Uncharacterized protein n=1 Tax=Amycolatopsis cihanbeyliensis TaxID=1128664 RepID=A0A542DKP1_AMYCI|nr:hypothetical protein [Amycolatopsis cihanbeyliensis]TQJ03495.1 hypothetical protein FB471_3257 [Amycolatopsis cihanbeyliensis]
MAVFEADPGQSAAVGVGMGVGAVADATMARSFNAANVEAATRQADKMLTAAKAGRFRISERGVAPLTEAIDEVMSRLNDRIWNSQKLTQLPKLGGHQYGQQVAQHDQQSGAGERGAAEALKQYRGVLEKVREALEQASKRYRETEDAQVDAMGKGAS